MRIPRSVLRGLLSQTGLGLVEKTIYLLIVEYHPRSVYELAKQAQVSRNLASRVCKDLARLGWIALVEYGNSLRPIPLIPQMFQEEMVRILVAGYRVAGNKGEFLMKRCLDMWVQSDEYEENARPEFLRNPKTKELMEYDRFYFQGVAFEFNGNQHYGVTELFSDERAIEDLQTRDLMKESLSRRNGIELVTITALDLEPASFGTLIPDNLPKNAEPADGLCCQAFTRLCRSYRANTPELSSAQQASAAVRKHSSPGSLPNRT